MARPLLWLAVLCASSLTFTASAGLRLELIHVDAKANRTVSERMRLATARTHRRLASMSGGVVTAPIHWSESQYIAEYLIGVPPQRAEAIIDTGSNLIWTQCSACRFVAGCFTQNLTSYDPSLSTTAAVPMSCNDTTCSVGSETRCARDGQTCAVVTAYGAGAIAGVLGTELFTFGSQNVSLAFGCITATRLTPGSLDGSSGLIGLGRGNLSLVSQLGETKFSYCLTPYFSDAVNTSHLLVGDSASLTAGGAPVTTVPFVKNPSDFLFGTFYFLPLSGISVGQVKLDVPAAAFELRQVLPGQWAGTLIDSGSPFTSLVDVAYQALRAELARQLGASNSSIVPPPEGFDLCVAAAQGDAGEVVPPLVLHFGGGAGAGGDVVVPPENYWGPVAPGRWAGTFIDSGTPFTKLVDVAYQALRAELARQLGVASLVPPPATASKSLLELCVANGNSSLVPPLVLHFGSGGGDHLVVPPENYWGAGGQEHGVHGGVQLGAAERDAAEERDDRHRQLHDPEHAPTLRPRQWRALVPTGGLQLRVMSNCMRLNKDCKLALIILCVSLTVVTTCAGLHVELTHVDAKEGCTVGERLRRATERTHRRLASMAAGVTAPVHWAGTSQYIADYLIGDPPQRAEAIIDTGSNLIWTQCVACNDTNDTNNNCFNQSLPFYDPSQSSSFEAVACNDSACSLGSETQPCALGGEGNMCPVHTGYGLGNISGFLDTETFTFGSENVSSLAFGCIDASDITPGSLNNASGIIGLGRGNLSLVSQLGESNFSYCLTPYFSDNTTSHLFVGGSAGLSGGGNNATVTSVSFVESPGDYPFSSFYYLPLSGITVGNATLDDVPAEAFELRQVAPGEWAGTFIDSGTPFTRLVDVAYQALTAELARQLNASVVTPPEGFDLCVAVAQGDAGDMVPPLVLHFGGGGASDLVVPPENYWVHVETDTTCMAVFSAAGQNATLPMNETTVIGNYMQQNMHLLYDLDNGVLSFQPADCSSM
ncbi:hypothetical protein HU200_052768 [Digitaria exilis]|uniref:Peptidase A1 domain-containing protein n=1 Tax=Digitaria exilis TaxID=1010633 RepID=A0A835E3X4_9POAL|nr:hypothetical protein HU200_052768 [Digitaria exilis]